VSAGRVIAIVLGVLVIGLGVNGVRIGKVVVRTVRPPWPGYLYRDKEPMAFWIVVSLWITLGTFIITGVLLAKSPV
jgi:hypothetical protein